MKGVFFTMITFVIFISILTYMNVVTESNIERSAITAERISAERIYYTWKAVDDHIEDILNISFFKNNDTAKINDTLPATQDIEDFLKLYQQFINQSYEDPTIDIRFENYDGDEIDLSTMDPQTLFVIEPMKINYSYPDFGKNRLFIKTDPSNFSFIDSIKLYIKMKNVYFDCSPPMPDSPKECEKWSPDNTLIDCSGVSYCLNFDLTFEDANTTVTKIFNFVANYFDVGSPKKSVVNLPVRNETASFTIKVEVGPLPTVIDIDLHNVLVDTSIEMDLNTTDFYINLASILNVSTVFGKKVDDL